MSKRIRTPEYLERRKAAQREKRRQAREALGFKSAEEFRRFAAAQAAKVRAARLVDIKPSVVKSLAMQSTNVPGETVEQFLARGGVIHRCPGFTGIKPGPIPARQILGTGARAA